MKKFFASFFGIAMIFAAVMAFSSCGNGGSNEPVNPGNDTTPTGPSRAMLIGTWQAMAAEEVIDTCVTDLTSSIQVATPDVFKANSLQIEDSLFSIDIVDLGCRFANNYEWDGETLVVMDPNYDKFTYRATIDRGRLRFCYYSKDGIDRFLVFKKTN